MRTRSAVLAAFLLLVAGAANAQITITLQNRFIEQFKNRVTIDATYTVDRAHQQPNPPEKDADLHAAGRAPEIGLATVAEVMNAASQQTAVDRIHSAQASHAPLRMSGAWRLWCEHGGEAEHIQGDPLEPFSTTNPPHVFEIHPITRIENADLLPSLQPIDPRFHTKDAQTAFTAYENIHCRIVPDRRHQTTTLVTGMAGFNYVEFIMELVDDHPFPVEDGQMVLASVLDLDGELIINQRRMVFVKDSQSEVAVRNLRRGDRLHVLGIPRIDLDLVSWRVQHAGDRRHPLEWNLPYEMIIAAVYPQQR